MSSDKEYVNEFILKLVVCVVNDRIIITKSLVRKMGKVSTILILEHTLLVRRRT